MSSRSGKRIAAGVLGEPSANVPRRARIEVDLPVESLIPLAVREGNRKKPVYEIHKWWARRLGSNFRLLMLGALLPHRVSDARLWREFYAPKRRDSVVVLDPFMGGGTSIVEATKLGARTIGNDIDPVAWFVTKKEIEPCDVSELRAEFARVEAAVAEEMRRYYRCTLPNGRTADVTTYFWVTVVTCRHCMTRFDAHPHYRLYDDSDAGQQVVFCRECNAVAQIPSSQLSWTCGECSTKTVVSNGRVRAGSYRCACGHAGTVVSQGQAGSPPEARLFALEYEVPGGEGRAFARVESTDRTLFNEAETILKGSWDALKFPRVAIPDQQRYDERPRSYGYQSYHQLFNARQLLCLSRLYERICKIGDVRTREFFLLAFSDALASNNMFCAYAFGYRKLTPLFGLHAYRFVTRPVEGNVWGVKFGRGSFLKCFEKLIRGKEYCSKPYEFIGAKRDKVFTSDSISASTTMSPDEWYANRAQALLLNRDSARLEGVCDGTVDLILTDPPYYNNLPYSELSDFYYVWLRDRLPHPELRWNDERTPSREGLFVRRRTVEEHAKFSSGMAMVFKECRRVLRPNGMLVFTYHHNDRRAWIVLGNALQEAGFAVTKVLPLLAEGKSGFHSAAGNIKWDAVFVCRRTDDRQLLGPVTPARVSRFAEKELRRWTKRLDKTSHGLSAADSASLAFAFGVWRICKSKVSADDVVRCLDAISLNVNGQTPAPWLFKTEAGAIRASKSKAVAP